MGRLGAENAQGRSSELQCFPPQDKEEEDMSWEAGTLFSLGEVTVE